MQGLAIKVTHLGLTTESLLLSDIFDGTDGPDHNRRKPDCCLCACKQLS